MALAACGAITQPVRNVPVGCYAACDAVSIIFVGTTLGTHRGFGEECNRGIVCYHELIASFLVAQKHYAEKERAYALCQLPP